MNQNEFVRRVMDILSTLTPEQAQRLLDQLEARLWLMKHLGMLDEKRAQSLIWATTRARMPETLWSNFHTASPVTGVFQ